MNCVESKRGGGGPNDFPSPSSVCVIFVFVQASKVDYNLDPLSDPNLYACITFSSLYVKINLVLFLPQRRGWPSG